MIDFGIAKQMQSLTTNDKSLTVAGVFMGKPEYVENFMVFIARELREYMAKLGVRSIDEMVGRTDLLKRKGLSENGRAEELLLDRILADLSEFDREEQTFHAEKAYDFHLEDTKDEKVLLASKAVQMSIRKGKESRISLEVSNIDRSFGTLLGAEITRQNPEGLPEDTVQVECTGAGGQSFGAFIPKGLTLRLTGDSNDYFGKGLSGGKLIVRAPKEAAYDAEENIIIGNVALYGATSGEAYIAGMAGERFCIRNAGVTAVVEGVGEHGCEYMTGGRAVILGIPMAQAGIHAGFPSPAQDYMDGIMDLNKELVLMEHVEQRNEKEELKRIIERHVESTGSKKGQRILEDFDHYIGSFKKIIPADYKKLLHLIAQGEEQGMSREQAETFAFHASQGTLPPQTAPVAQAR